MIKDLPINERPREKAMLYGIEYLSEIELLAIILKNGYKGCSVIQLSTTLIEKFNGLYNVLSANENDLKKIKGINNVKVLEIKTIQQIIKRIKLQKQINNNFIINSGFDVYNYYQYLMSSLKEEQLLMVALNTKNKIIREEIIERGNEKQINVDITKICQKALIFETKKIILVHNHPSGDSAPSNQDIEFTYMIKDALNIIKIKLLDHIVIGKNEFYSIKDEICFKINQ